MSVKMIEKERKVGAVDYNIYGPSTKKLHTVSGNWQSKRNHNSTYKYPLFNYYFKKYVLIKLIRMRGEASNKRPTI